MDRPDATRGARYEVLEHTADIGFRVEAPTLESLFETAAVALLAIAADTSDVQRAGHIDLDIDGEDHASVLVNFLSEILYLFDAGRYAPSTIDVERVTPTSVRARLDGEVRDPARHPWRLIVKAVTYHDLEVAERQGRWHARVFLDV
jgi:SHS2 domain-containing protein